MVLNHEEIKYLLIGATFMASGGGGSLDAALKMLNDCKEEEVTLYDSNSLESDEYTMVIAAMGSPEAIKDQDFDKILNNTYLYIKEQISKSGKNIVGCIPVEYGGFNTFVPIYLALKHPEIKLIDAEGSGRAVPGLDTTFLSLKKCPITPMVLCDNINDSIFLDTKGNLDTSFMENICRNICEQSTFGSIAGLAGWIMNKETLNSSALNGNLTKALEIGKYIMEYHNILKKEDNIFSYLQSKLSDQNMQIRCIGYNNGTDIYCKLIGVTEPNKQEDKNSPGFDVATIKLELISLSKQHKKEIWTIRYINESLEIECDKIPFMTAPNIVCIIDDKTGLPLSNDFIHSNWSQLEDRAVSFGIVRIDSRWDEFSDSMDNIWCKYFDAIGYSGNCIPFPEC